MLQRVWAKMAAQIPVLESQELWNGYLVNLAAQPEAGKAGHDMAKGWLEVASSGFKSMKSAVDTSMAAAFARVRGAFGDAIRE